MKTGSAKEIKVRVEFNSVFAPVNESSCRYRILKGSAGSGKSVNVAQDYILKLSDPVNKGANLLVVRKVEESNRNSTFAELQSAIRRIFGEHWPLLWDVRQGTLELRCRMTGSSVIFRGMLDSRQREKVKSITFPAGKLTWIWAEEATELLEEDMDILDDRLRGLLTDALFYQITMTFNPISAAHWIKRRFWDQDSPDIFRHHSTYLDNRFIDPAFHKRMDMRRRLDPEGYRVYGLGEWGETGGLILPHVQVHDFPRDFKSFDSMVNGQDFGFNHANAILEVGFKDGEIYVCREIYEYEKDTTEHIEAAAKKGFNKSFRMLCDAAEPDRIQMWKRAGWNAKPCVKHQGSVKAQIDYLKGHPVHIHPECVNAIKEAQSWKWRKDRTTGQYTDEPVEIADDAMAALRYAVSDRVGGEAVFKARAVGRRFDWSRMDA